MSLVSLVAEIESTLAGENGVWNSIQLTGSLDGSMGPAYGEHPGMVLVGPEVMVTGKSITKVVMRPGAVAHAGNPSYLGGGD
jgi:hypothetical protein